MVQNKIIVMDKEDLAKAKQKLQTPQPCFIAVDMASGKDQTGVFTIHKEPEPPVTQNVLPQIGDNCPKQHCGGTITHNWRTGQTKCNRCDFVIVKDDKE